MSSSLMRHAVCTQIRLLLINNVLFPLLYFVWSVRAVMLVPMGSDRFLFLMTERLVLVHYEIILKSAKTN